MEIQKIQKIFLYKFIEENEETLSTNEKKSRSTCMFLASKSKAREKPKKHSLNEEDTCKIYYWRMKNSYFNINLYILDVFYSQDKHMIIKDSLIKTSIATIIDKLKSEETLSNDETTFQTRITARSSQKTRRKGIQHFIL